MELFGNKKHVLPTTWLRLFATASALIGFPSCAVYDPSLEPPPRSPDGGAEDGRIAPRDGTGGSSLIDPTGDATHPSDGSMAGSEPQPDLDAPHDPERAVGDPDAAPDGAASDATVVDAITPDARTRDAAADVAAPESAAPDVGAPDASMPEVATPDVTTPDPTPEPTPDVGAPEAATPDVATIDASPDTTAPTLDASSENSDGSCGLPAIARDGCVELAPLATPPVIDGNPECGVLLSPLTAVGWSGGAIPNDTTTSYAVRWRPDGIYFYVLVQDPALIPAEPTALAWMGDAVEIYLDSDSLFTPPNYDNPGARQIIMASPSGAAPTVARADLFSFGNAGFPQSWTSSEFGAYTKPGGYAVEGFVRAADLGLPAWSLAAGQTVGLDLSIDVSHPTASTIGIEGHRAGQYFLHLDPTPGATPPYSNPNAFCKPLLLVQ